MIALEETNQPTVKAQVKVWCDSCVQKMRFSVDIIGATNEMVQFVQVDAPSTESASSPFTPTAAC